METFRDQLLAGATLADHQHRPVERSGPARALNGGEKLTRLSDELVCALHTNRLADFPIYWQVLFSKIHPTPGIFPGFPLFSKVGTPSAKQEATPAWRHGDTGLEGFRRT